MSLLTPLTRCHPLREPAAPKLERGRPLRTLIACLASLLMAGEASAQLTDVTQTPNPAGAGIQKSMQQQVGAGRGDELLPGSSIFTIRRDPFRAVARGRQLFQRKFTHAQGLGPRAGDGIGDITTQGALGAGLSDSCASCHGRPRGSAGVGGNVFTRPESRDAPHLFGLGLVEMLGDEITRDLRSIRKRAQARALRQGGDVTASLLSKGIDFGWITARADGTLDTSRVRGVDGDLRVRPFFAQGGTISIREFAVGAFNAEMGLQAFDPDLLAAAGGQDVVTPAGMVLSGSLDAVEAPPANSPAADPDHDGMVDELPASLVDFMEFYLLNYFPPGTGRQNQTTERGRNSFEQIGCAECHVPDLWIDRDRRVADVRTAFDEDRSNGVFNQLFATATTRHDLVQDGSPFPALKPPSAQPFLVRGIFADFRRHDLGSAFHERNFDGSVQTLFMTEPLWGVGSTAPYGHDGRSSTLEDVILRHGGEAQLARDGYLALPQARRSELLAFLSSLVLFSPPDTASNLDPIRPLDPDYPRLGHGSIDLAPLFLVPGDRE